MRAEEFRARVQAGARVAGAATPGFDDPALASLPPGGNLYFAADQAVASKIVGPPAREPHSTGHGQAMDTRPPSLMFGERTATTSQGEAVVNAAHQSGTGHFSEILNFHGSPAPWILLGILLAAGLLHLSANAKFRGEL
jgi:hypothetical protein